MSKITKLATATGALALALSIGSALANEKDRQPASSTSPTSTSTPTSTSPSSTPPTGASSSTMPSSSTTTSPTSASTTASASTKGQATGRPFAQFKDIDVNADGTISADELSANTSVQIDLATYDSNKDGKLSESEYARYKNQMARNNPQKDDSKSPEQR